MPCDKTATKKIQEDIRWSITMEDCYFYMFILCKLYTRVFQFQYYIGKKIF